MNQESFFNIICFIFVLGMISCVHEVNVFTPKKEESHRNKSDGTSSIPVTAGGPIGGKPVSVAELTSHPSWRSVSNIPEIIDHFEKDVAISFGVIMETLRFNADGTAQRSFEGHRDSDNMWRSLGGNYFSKSF